MGVSVFLGGDSLWEFLGGVFFLIYIYIFFFVGCSCFFSKGKHTRAQKTETNKQNGAAPPYDGKTWSISRLPKITCILTKRYVF